jgi:hypothetical protein
MRASLAMLPPFIETRVAEDAARVGLASGLLA